MKKGTIIKKENASFVILSVEGRGKNKVFNCSEYKDNFTKLSKMKSTVKFNVDEISNYKPGGTYRHITRSSIKDAGGNSYYMWWEKIKKTENLDLKAFITMLVNAYGHPYAASDTYHTACHNIVRGIIGDKRSQSEITASTRMYVSDMPEYQNATTDNELYELAVINEIAKYVSGDIEDIKRFAQTFVVQKYYGNINGEPVPDRYRLDKIWAQNHEEKDAALNMIRSNRYNNRKLNNEEVELIKKYYPDIQVKK